MALAIKRRVEGSLLAHVGLVFVQIELFEDDFGFSCDGFSVEFLIQRDVAEERKDLRQVTWKKACVPAQHAKRSRGITVLETISLRLCHLARRQQPSRAGERRMLHEMRQSVLMHNLLAAQNQG